MKKTHISEKLIIALILALIGGMIDAYTYIFRGQVFAFAQTGNMIFFGMNLAKGNIFHAFEYLIPVLAFSLGVVLTELIKKYFQDHHIFHWKQIILILEAFILLISLIVPFKEEINWIVTSMIAFVCAMQVDSFRTVMGNPYASTMCTGNLRSCMDSFTKYLLDRNIQDLYVALSYLSIIICFILGAGSLTYLVGFISGFSLFIPIVILLLLSLLMFKKSY